MENFISYGRQSVGQEEIEAVLEVLKSDYMTQGPKVTEFEQAICDYTGAKYAVAIANGTAALHIAVAALQIEKGKEGITSPNTFLASANCMVYENLKPVFADIDANSFNIDSSKILDKVNSNTKLCIPVHFAGRAVNIKELREDLPDDVFIIEDAAHAIGSEYSYGGKVGNCENSDMTIFSFHPVKTITTAEGGAITTNSKELYERLCLLRSHGVTKDPEKLSINPGPWYYEMHDLGFNYRMTDMQAALGIVQLAKLDDFVAQRQSIYKRYNQAFAGISCLKTPEFVYKTAYHLYVLQIDFKALAKPRKQVMQELKEKGIGTQVHYIPVHSQPFYKERFAYADGDYPVAEAYYEQALSLPLFPSMSEYEQLRVIEAVNEVLK